MVSVLERPIYRPFLLLLTSVLLCFSMFTHGHPQDEDIVLDIEMGQMQLNAEQMDEEYLAALKRKRLRKLTAMSSGEKFRLFVWSGFEHIIPKGLDHILFVLGLFFSSLLLASLLWQITAFTLAHSITLGLASVGYISAPGSIVEPLIALSIAWLAVENCVFTQTKPWRPAVVFAFGLLHGLGFASVLSDYGLPKDDVLTALFAFNIGVEIGQIAVIAAAFIVTYLVRQKSWYRSYVQIPASVGVGAVGLYWFIERVFG